MAHDGIDLTGAMEKLDMRSDAKYTLSDTFA